MFLHRRRTMLGTRSSTSSHPDLQKKRIQKDESSVQPLTDLIQNSLINPDRSEEDSLVNISTGTLAPADVEKDLFTAQSIGEKTYQKFKTDRLEKEAPDAVDFHATIKKQKRKTFAQKSAMQRERGHPTSRSQSFCQNDCYRTMS